MSEITDRARALRATIEEIAEAMTDTKALQNIELFKHWVADHDYVADERFQFNGRLYKTRQAHHSQENWTPDITPALYEEVAEKVRERKIIRFHTITIWLLKRANTTVRTELYITATEAQEWQYTTTLPIW